MQKRPSQDLLWFTVGIISMLTLPFGGKKQAIEAPSHDVETVTTVVQTVQSGQNTTKKITRVNKKKNPPTANGGGPGRESSAAKPRRGKSVAAHYAISLRGEADSTHDKKTKMTSLVPQTLRSIPSKALKSDLFGAGKNVTVPLHQGTTHRNPKGKKDWR